MSLKFCDLIDLSYHNVFEGNPNSKGMNTVLVYIGCFLLVHGEIFKSLS